MKELFDECVDNSNGAQMVMSHGMTSNTDSALRRLPTLRYNVQSYRNFVLRCKAYFSKDDDMHDVIQGSFWSNNAGTPPTIEAGDTAPQTMAIQTPAKGKDSKKLVAEPVDVPKAESDGKEKLVKRCNKANRAIHSILVPGMHDECNKILDGLPDRDGKALWDAIIAEFDQPTRANTRRTC